MKTVICVTGATRTPYLSEGIKVYTDRLRHYMPCEMLTLPDVRATKGMTEARQKQAEGAQILAALQPGDHLCLLDERGKEMTSREFAAWIDTRMVSGLKRLVITIGGPYGFSDEVYARADSKLSLSRMTFSHEMVRLFIAEQLYRAMTILRGEPYHHD